MKRRCDLRRDNFVCPPADVFCFMKGPQAEASTRPRARRTLFSAVSSFPRLSLREGSSTLAAELVRRRGG